MFKIIETAQFSTWFKKFKDLQAKAYMIVRIKRLKQGHFGDCKSIGGGVYELRIHKGAGYRIYYAIKNKKVVILLVGGDKSTQSKDITKAKNLKRIWNEYS